MPMVRSLDTIFNGLANTYLQQGRVGGRPLNEGFDDTEERTREGTPGFAAPGFSATGRLFPRDADGPQPMTRSVDTLGEYVSFLCHPCYFHGATVLPDEIILNIFVSIVFLISFKRTLMELADGLEEVASES